MPTTAAEPKSLHVAVGVITDGGGRVLLARRPDAAHQGGLWEFPGGKVEAGENVEQALARELREELAIEVESARPLMHHHHAYERMTVHLDVWWVESFSGDPRGVEGQPLSWVAATDLKNHGFPAANGPIVDAVLEHLGSGAQ